MSVDYETFLARKRIVDPSTGMETVPALPAFLFPHQADIVAWALRRGRAAIFAGTGLGKTAMELVWADIVAAYTDKPVLVFAPLAVSAQHIREAKKFGLNARLVKDQSEVRHGINVTNYQKIEHFDLSLFGGVVLDECFAPDTPIDIVDQHGNVSQKHIKEIKVGDKIRNASGVDSVSDIHRREVPYAVRIRYAGREVIASPNHPFLTQRGWVGSQDLEPGDTIIAAETAVRMVQGRVRSASPSRNVETLLRQVLLSEMADAPAGDTGEDTFAGSGSEARAQEKRVVTQRRSQSHRGNRTHYCAQSNVHAGRQGESLPSIESHEARTFRAWGQWSRNDQAAIVADGGTLRQLDSGICFVTGATDSRISHALQDRLGERRRANSYRGGWSLASLQKASGREEGRETLGFGVEGVEVLEPGHSDLDRYRDADGKLYFYDLGGTRHPSFSIHGALVHNSSILKSTGGHYRTKLIEDCDTVPFRLAATATPAPNDFMELGNHAEFLGVMSYTDMLATFFVHDGGDTQKWRLKGHAENEFWKWMASWAVMLRQPSDLGYDNAGYDLPKLNQVQHLVAAEYAPSLDTGLLFPMEATTMQERLAARRDTVAERVELAISIVTADMWAKLPECHGNPNTKQTDSTKLAVIQSTLRGSKKSAAEHPKKTGSTCAHTTPPTKKSGRAARLNSKPNTTPNAVSDTPLTLNSGIEPRQTPESERQTSAAHPCSVSNTSSPVQSTTKCSDSRTGSAQSVDDTIPGDVSTLTIATIPEWSEGFSAPLATPALGISKTTPTASPEPSNTSVRLDQWVIWCQLNSEQDALERAFGDLCLSVRGSNTDEQNERAILAFIDGERPIMIGKPSMMGFGLNLQCCHQTLFVGLNDSFEQVFQAIRRFWRFGQTKPVNAHFIAAETEGAVVANLRRKEADADRMAAAMIMHTSQISSEVIRGLVRDRPDYNPQVPMALPEWIGIAA